MSAIMKKLKFEHKENTLFFFKNPDKYSKKDTSIAQDFYEQYSKSNIELHEIMSQLNLDAQKLRHEAER